MYQPKTNAEERQELDEHVRIRGSNRGWQRCIDVLADLAACEAALAEEQRKVERLQRYIGVMDAALKIEDQSPERSV